MTYEEFVEYYNKYGKTINSINKANHKLNEIELKSKYEKYLKSLIKQKNAKERYNEQIKNKEIIVDQKWIDVCEVVDKRDNYSCRLKKLLNFDETRQLEENSFPQLLSTIDHAHIISRAQAPYLVYDVENIICLNRFSHSMIDQYRNPINCKSIKKEEQLLWWYRIVSKEHYDYLLSKTKYK